MLHRGAEGGGPRWRQRGEHRGQSSDVEVIRDKLLESPVLAQQAAGNLKEQFANSPDLPKELMNALMASFDAHTTMSTQALNSDAVRAGLLDILLNYRGLWEALREKAASAGT